jgi:hypothetical protein
MKFEFEGYVATLLMLKLILKERGCSKEEIQQKLEEQGNILNKYFKDSGYYYMWPFGVDFTKEIQSIMSGDICKDERYAMLILAYKNIYV